MQDRYGESNTTVANNLLPTVSVPSRTLKDGNLEILISSLGTSSGSSDDPIKAHTILVPTIAIRSTTTGKHTVVRYPVHKTIVCGEGVDGLQAYTRLIGGAKLEHTDAIRAAFDFCLRESNR